MSHIWRQLCTVATIVLLVLILLVNQFGSPLAEILMERQVYQHLQQQGYDEEDIANIRVTYHPRERNVYVSEVFFPDHGGYVRYYIYNSDKEIQELERISR
ncbi:MAG: DUF3139 domain-containing protein [Peptococcaceae bacterium]|nr:DUF3139 domain-containing protein [Peptococcaceae bacterium]